MQENNCQLRAIVASRDGGVEGQLLEIDIAARGTDVDDFLKELGHAIIVSYEMARDLGEAPFANLMAAPMNFQCQWNSAQAKQLGVIELPKEVGMALAIALHVRKPIRSIPVFEKMAA